MDILIVEDDRVLSLLLTRLVQKLGYNVVDALTKGEAAITFVENNKLDLIFMDIMLDGTIDGITAMEVIQAQKKIPALYITGNSDAMTLKRAKNTYHLDYLIKPVNHEKLAEVCKNFETTLKE